MSTPESPPSVGVPVTPAPVAPAKPSLLSKAWHGFLAAVTSPTAVAKEKSLGVFVAVRVLQAVGASAALVAFIEKLAG